MANPGGTFGEAMGCAGCCAAPWSDASLYRVVVPRQRMVVRINGLDLDASPDGYLAAVRPYGVLRTAWAIWREIPDVEPGRARALPLHVRRKGDTEVMVATRFLAEHTRRRLRARHRLVARLERAG
jgi:hypothetical protein